MSGLDKIISAVTPPASQEQRSQARARARAEATPGDWLSQILDHHQEIESAFAAVRAARDAEGRRAAQKRLAIVLTGHSIAEEAVVYPALAQAGHKANAMTAYEEQVAAKMQAAALDTLDPLTEDYLDKLGHLEGAVQTHMYEEENKWLLELKREAPEAEQAKISARYKEEFGRYMGGGESGLGQAAREGRSFGAEAI